MPKSALPQTQVPLSSFSPDAQRLIERVRSTRQSLAITKRGQLAVVVVEAKTYEEQQRRVALMERIVRGKREIAHGRSHTQEEVEALLDQWLAAK